MVIDLAKCVGCDACSVACKIENSLPEDIWWAPVIQREVGRYPKAGLQFLPLLCMHCEDPPCMKSCPTKAISQTDDGIVLINENRCTGSRSCIQACPYNAISLWRSENGHGPAIDPQYRTQVSLSPEKKHRIGAAQKCTFCSHRMDAAKETGLTPGVDRAATPACVITCPANCRIFGNVEDKASPSSKYLSEANASGRTVFVLRPEAQTKPKVAYVW